MIEDILCNNKLIIKTKEYIKNDPNDDVTRDANNNYLNKNNDEAIISNKNNNNYLTRLRKNLDENLEEISKINVEFKPSVSPSSSSLQMPSFENISSYSSISSSSSTTSSSKNKNKSVVFILNRNSLETNNTTEMKASVTSDNDESASLADSSFSSSSLSSTFQSINSSKNTDLKTQQSINDMVYTTGKVKHLRNKFSNFEDSNQANNNFKRKTSEFVKNFQLKKCQSVIFNIEPSNPAVIIKASNLEENKRLNFKHKARAQSNNCIGDLFDDTMTQIKNIITDSSIDESSVFDTCGVKERIRKFNNDCNNLNKDEIVNSSNLKRSTNEEFKKYGGSCNNLHLNKYSVNINKQLVSFILTNTKKKSSISSDADASNDESTSTFSDDLTNSDNDFKTRTPKPEFSNNYKLNKSKQIVSNNQNIIVDSFNYSAFEESYVKIKEAFNDLKKDNQQIESLLTLVRNKVKEASVTFLDNIMDMNDYTQIENISDGEDNSSSTNTTNHFNRLKLHSNENLHLVRHKF